MVLGSCELRVIGMISSFMGGLLYSCVHSQISTGLVRWMDFVSRKRTVIEADGPVLVSLVWVVFGIQLGFHTATQ